MKNERFGFSITYYENNRPRHYYPDFLVMQFEEGREIYWVVETKGEITPNTILNSEAANLWCQKMSGTHYGDWHFLLVPQVPFENAVKAGVKRFSEMARRLRAVASAKGYLD